VLVTGETKRQKKQHIKHKSYSRAFLMVRHFMLLPQADTQIGLGFLSVAAFIYQTSTFPLDLNIG